LAGGLASAARRRAVGRQPSAPLLAPLLLGLLGSVPAAAAGEDAAAILDRMNRAAERVAFEGTVVYLYGHDLAALRVSHRIGAGGVGESLLSLTGPVRAVARHAAGVSCMLPDSAPLTVQRTSGGGLLGGLPLDSAGLSRHYRVERLGVFRIAGRETDVVSVAAKDDYRYGYRFYVDQASGLPLKVDLLAHGGKPIQQIMFTDIDIDPAAAPAAAAQSMLPPRTPGADGKGAPQPKRLPAGFAVISRDALERDDGASVRQLVVSDGLASFSIYVEPPAQGALRGESRLGAVSAAGGRVGEHQVTVVGEVPPATVRMVLDEMAATAD
jgi:sigma-E factor negative regulatory protein RseB